ncbi:Recombination endonuclease VII [Actinacidiphila yanglinensis]|uniref:Recombination endonuclease VII n=1 Tax=Actinacidiphila yanglinensis TaxID=310779 RepID=A0A1H6DJ50_9ACTN|nr:Recombination endonuclease VII [Actinacidiphila yanglinensis]SEG91085.1 Recombination endonuclease VII [Actinacidiphila yanglinensis]
MQYLADEMRDCSIPVAPEHFQRRRFTEHDDVFFGYVPVRAYKHANQWRFHEADVRQAARTIASLAWDPEDLVDPRHAVRSELQVDVPLGTSWRSQLLRLFRSAARDARRNNGCPCGPLGCQRGDTNWALPCGLTQQDLLRRYGHFAIACTLPVPALVWTQETWLIPRTLANILDRWEEAQGALTATIHTCGGCGALDTGSAWRTATASGWRILCPQCAAAGLRRYRNELNGASYARIQEQGPRARDYLCGVCRTPRPATDWDHCHDHGMIRGPLCGSCNTKEGHGKEFLAMEGSIAHLLRCDGCRAERKLPPHHRLAALRRHAHREWGAADCDWPMQACVTLDETDESGIECTVRCPEQRPSRSTTVRLTADEAERVVLLTVESELT